MPLQDVFVVNLRGRAQVRQAEGDAEGILLNGQRYLLCLQDVAV